MHCVDIAGSLQAWPRAGERCYIPRMGEHRGLLDRLAAGETRKDVVGSVVAHLRDLLNTRQGDSQTVPDYGLVDFADVCHHMPKGVAMIQQQMRAVIQKYEPRLRNVSVRHVPNDDPLTLSFEVVGRIDDGERRIVRLSTTVNAGGQVTVD